jgi:hypothetical protein
MPIVGPRHSRPKAGTTGNMVRHADCGVARRRRDRLVPDNAAAAGAIDDVHRFAEVFLNRAREHPRDVGIDSRIPGSTDSRIRD